MARPKGLKKKNLQCPFTWNTPLIPFEANMSKLEDAQYLCGDAWSLVIHKVRLAYQYAMRNDLKRSKMRLVECYIPLLDQSLLHLDSEMVHVYSIALKHVLDATWAFVCCKTTTVEKLEPFLQQITPFDSMDSYQQSAVWAIRAISMDKECEGGHSIETLNAVEYALTLNPDEGMWYFYKAILMSPKFGSKIINEVNKCLRLAYERRPTPDTMITYGTGLTHEHRKPMNVKKGFQLLREALVKWPSNAFVNYHCGYMFSNFHPGMVDLSQAEKCLRIAVQLADNCIDANHALGSFLVRFRDKAEGRKYLHVANTLLQSSSVSDSALR